MHWFLIIQVQKKIADEVIAELEKEDLYTEDEVYSQDVIAMMYEMYHNFDPDVKWLEKMHCMCVKNEH